MSESTSNHIIQYTADMDGLLSKLKELQRLNSVAASQMTTDFSRAVDIVEQKFSKLSQSTIKVPVLDNNGKATKELRDQVTVIEQLTSTVKNSSGGFEKFVETNTRIDGGLKKSTISLVALKAEVEKQEKPARIFLGTLEKITSQLTNLDRVSNKVRNAFGDNAGVASIGSPRLSATKTQTTTLDGRSVLQQTQTFDTAVKLADGTTKNLRDTLVSVNGQVTKTSSVFAEASTSARTFGDNLKTLLSRAALTIPVWFALRNSILSVFNGIRDGVSNFITFDTALQKLKLNITGTPAEIEAGFDKAKATITDFSRQTGVSTEEITKAVEKFATIGFSIDDALAGGIESTKLAIVLFGDATEVATAYAAAIKIFADETKGATSVQQQMAEAFALTAQLQATNQFDINEVTESLKKFAPVAKQAGLSLRETLVTLAALGTAGITGSNAGTILSTSINKLRGNADKLKGIFDIDVKPLDSTFSILQKIVNKSEQLGKRDKLGKAQAEALSEIFGGEKGIKTVSALTAMNKVLNDNAAIVVNVDFLEQKFQKTQDTLGNNVRKLVNDLKENGKSFVNAAVGGNDFNESIKKIDSTVNGLGKALTGLGVILNSIAVVLPSVLGVGLFVGALQAAAKFGILASVPSFIAGGALLGESLLIGLGAVFASPLAIAGLVAALAVGFKAIPSLIQKSIESASVTEGLNVNKITQGLRGKLSNADLGHLIFQIKTGELKLSSEFKNSVNLKQIQKQLQEVLDKNAISVKPNIVSDLSSVTPKQNQDINAAIIQDRLETLRTQGATTSELLKQETILRRLFGLYEAPVDALKRQLATQRAINDEQGIKNKLSSTSKQLADVARTDGIDIAKKIGDVFQGNIDFTTFARIGGKAFEVFKEKFKSDFQEQQDQALLFGNSISGVNDIRGGQNIPIAERIPQNPELLNLSPDQLKSQTEQLKQISVDNRIQANIKISVEGLSFAGAVSAVKEALINDLKNTQSDFSKELDAHVEGI